MKTLQDAQKHFQTQAEAQGLDACWVENNAAFDLIQASPDLDVINALAVLQDVDLIEFRKCMTSSYGFSRVRERYSRMAILLNAYK